MSSVSLGRAWLIPLPGGIPLEPLELSTAGNKRSIVIGRNKNCDLMMPVGAEKVSRRHAEFVSHDGHWRVADLGSRWGTTVNGVTLQPNRPVRLNEGDLLRIQPWTFRFSRDRASPTGAVAVDDGMTTIVRTHVGQPTEPLRQDMLALLLEGASTIQAAVDESALATALLDLARRGTGLEHATVLRALDANGHIETVASSHPGMKFSRSLLATASQGAVAEFARGGRVDPSQSILQADITTAICAPLMLGATVAAYLYLDSRGGADERVRPSRANAAGFCQALCRMGGLALANLKRIDIERRAAHMEAELNAAAAAQRWILPREPVAADPFICVGQSQAGGYLGGDFFDAQVLPDGRLAVSLGDVSGHGVAASVLMTAAQGFLHAFLSVHGDVARAVNGLNAFILPRCPPETFVTLWIGIFDPQRMSLDYVDAGHGYAMLVKADRSAQMLDENGGIPVGVDGNYQYETATAGLAPQCQVLIFSDGIVEQVNDAVLPDGRRSEFGKDGVRAAVESYPGEDLLKHLFQALSAFTGGKGCTDDVTGVVVRWPSAT